MAIEKTYLTGSGVQLGTSHFDLQAQKPLDSRTTVPEFAGLQALIDGKAAYEGMIVYDEETKKTYQAHKVTVTEDDGTSKVILQFKEFGINQEELKALIASETTAAMEFKGAATALPENPAKGDMYKVTASFKVGEEDVKVGDSIVYDGEQWFIIPSGDDIEDTWRPVTDVDNDASLTFVAGDKLDVAVASNGTVTYSHEAIDAPELLAENEQTRTYITAVETDGYGHITGYKTATENVVDTNTTYEFEGQAEESSVYFQVTSSEEGASAEVVYLDAYSKNEANAELAKKVDKVEGKSLVLDTEIARLSNMSDGANKVESSATNGNIKIDGVETVVYTHPDKHTASEISDFATEVAKVKVNEAIKATQDGDGNVISTTYAKVEDLNTLDGRVDTISDNLRDTDGNVDTLLQDMDILKGNDTVEGSVAKVVKDATDAIHNNLIGQGETDWIVAEAEVAGHATTANEATKATQDGNGKVISDTYALKSDVDTLKGGVTVEGSVAKAVKDAIDGLDLSDTYVAKEDGKSLIADSEITRLAGMKDGANKVEASTNNGKIKIDGVETTVYTHPDGHTVSEITDFDDKVKEYGYATTEEMEAYAVEKKYLDRYVDNSLYDGAKIATLIVKDTGEVWGYTNLTDEQFHSSGDCTTYSIRSSGQDGFVALNLNMDGLTYNVNSNIKNVAFAEDISENYAKKATTLAGYGIGNAYTKTEVENLLTWGEF